MGQPAAVSGDQITGTCPIHQVPNPASGVPQPAGPLPFAAPLTIGLAATVLIENKPAAVQGSSGYNSPPHVGLHASDPYMTPVLQEGKVVVGSPTVQFEGKQAASTGSQVMCCATPGQLVGSAASVQIA